MPVPGRPLAPVLRTEKQQRARPGQLVLEGGRKIQNRVGLRSCTSRRPRQHARESKCRSKMSPTPDFKQELAESLANLRTQAWVAERVGFEPTCRLPDKTLSRRPRYDHFGTSPVGCGRSA